MDIIPIRFTFSYHFIPNSEIKLNSAINVTQNLIAAMPIFNKNVHEVLRAWNNHENDIMCNKMWQLPHQKCISLGFEMDFTIKFSWIARKLLPRRFVNWFCFYSRTIRLFSHLSEKLICNAASDWIIIIDQSTLSCWLTNDHPTLP